MSFLSTMLEHLTKIISSQRSEWEIADIVEKSFSHAGKDLASRI